MNVLLINGSPHAKGSGFTALHAMDEVFKENGIETELIQAGSQQITGCTACDYCQLHGKCIANDLVNEIAEKFEKADGIVVSSPVYFASANATVIALLDKLFYSTTFDKTMKVGAGIVTLRRGGASATFDEINKYFTVSGMPVVSSQYWNSLYGLNAEESHKDLEGLQTMRILARNMTFLMKSIALGKEKYGLPMKEDSIMTNFIR